MLEGYKNFWETNYKQNIAKMISICYRYTHNRQVAEDLAHDAFLLAIDKSSSFESRGAFEAWLRRIVVNVSLQYLREQKKQKLHVDGIAYAEDLVEDHSEKQASEDPEFTKTELLEAIKLLPEHHRLVFNLYVIDHFTHAQIAAELGISEGTSKSHLARARKKIRELLAQRLKEKNRKKTAFLFLVLPFKFWDVDPFFNKQFSDFTPYPPKVISKFYLTTVGAGVATLGVISILYFNQKIEELVNISSVSYRSNPVSTLHSKHDLTNKFPAMDTSTATFSKNDIILAENNKTMKEMKNLKTLGATLMLSSVLTLDTSSLMKNFELPVVLKKQPMPESAQPDLAKPAESTQLEAKTKTNRPPLSGTFYASNLSWESPNNALVLKGNRVKVNLNTQKFNGDGTFCFVDHVDYILVDGVPMKLNETVRLSYKKYSLNQLIGQEATKKYGEQVRSAIEIAAVE